MTLDSATGQIFTWTNETYNDPVFYYLFDEDHYELSLRYSSLNTIVSYYPERLASFQATVGEAKLTIQLGD